MKFNKDEKLILKILLFNEIQFYEDKEELTIEDKDYMDLLQGIIEKLVKESD